MPDVKLLATPDGTTLLVPDEESPGQLAFLWNEIYGEVAIYDDADCTISQGDVVIDVGANFGLFALRAIERYGAGLVVCVEADPLNAACLLENLESRGYGDRIAIVNRAAFSHGNGVTFTRVEGDPACHFVSEIYPERADPPHEVQVPSVTVDQIVEQLGLDRVDFIKSDAEGSEVDVLLGAEHTIRRHKPKMIITTYHRPHHPTRIAELVAAYGDGYRTKLVDKGICDQVLMCW
jgi:FkbM family methyltransferase